MKIKNVTWHTDELGTYWTADLLRDDQKIGVTGNYYEIAERRLDKMEQIARAGFCIQCGKKLDNAVLCSDRCKSDYDTGVLGIMRSEIMNCPVCDTKLKARDHANEYGPGEVCQWCSECDYAYEFSYGDYLVHVGGKTWGWRYGQECPQDEIDQEIKRQRYGRRLPLMRLAWWIRNRWPHLARCAQCDLRFLSHGEQSSLMYCSDECQIKWEDGNGIPF
jgi:hypothetical protein